MNIKIGTPEENKAFRDLCVMIVRVGEDMVASQNKSSRLVVDAIQLLETGSLHEFAISAHVCEVNGIGDGAQNSMEIAAMLEDAVDASKDISETLKNLRESRLKIASFQGQFNALSLAAKKYENIPVCVGLVRGFIDPNTESLINQIHLMDKYIEALEEFLVKNKHIVGIFRAGTRDEMIKRLLEAASTFNSRPREEPDEPKTIDEVESQLRNIVKSLQSEFRNKK